MHRYLKTKISYSRIHIKGFICCLLAMTPWLSLVTLVPAMFTPAWPLYLLLYWLLYLQCLPLPGPCTCNVYPCLAPVPAMFTPAWPLYLQCLPLPGPCTCNVYPCLLVRRLVVTCLTKSIAQFNLIIWTMNLKISYGKIHPFM